MDDLGNQLKVGGSQPVSNLDRYSWALFAEDAWNITDPFTLTMSLRMDQDENLEIISVLKYMVYGL